MAAIHFLAVDPNAAAQSTMHSRRPGQHEKTELTLSLTFLFSFSSASNLASQSLSLSSQTRSSLTHASCSSRAFFSFAVSEESCVLSVASWVAWAAVDADSFV